MVYFSVVYFLCDLFWWCYEWIFYGLGLVKIGLKYEYGRCDDKIEEIEKL